MKKTIILPRLGELLRTLITRAGYRGHITKLGLDKDLDDLANESRGTSTCDLMMAIEDACRKELALDCGVEWAQFFGWAWLRTRDAVQKLARSVDTSPLADERDQEEVLRLFEIPMLSGFLQIAISQCTGPVAGQWWKSPIAAWVQWASTKAKVSNDLLLKNLAHHFDTVDPRSIARWMAGEPLRELHCPYRPVVDSCIGKDAPEPIKDQITGWLIVAVAFQSLPADVRDSVQRNFDLQTQQPWFLEYAIHELNRHAFERGSRQERNMELPKLHEKLQKLFGDNPRNVKEIRQALQEFHSLIDREVGYGQQAYQCHHAILAARLAAITGDKDEALRLYAAAVDDAWWHAGTNQQVIINEALLFAIGNGKKIAAEHYWDKTFLLGLNNWPKRPLDDQERRRLAFGFEQMFAPQKAKDRISPKIEAVVREGEFELSPQALGNPNRKVKHAKGRTRRTPLMDAILDGTLGDVKRVIAAGGDPNDFINESGEGPLSYAMRRACDRKDTAIMEHLLSLDLLPETVNRQASTMRETPLKIAIEMADASAVDRLIELGADFEAPCDLQPSALCYAMLLLHGSIHRNDLTQELAYMAGKTPANVYDAKDGAVLDVDLAARRRAQLALRHASPRKEQIWNEVMDYHIRPAEDHRKVIQVLLHHKADANRRYKVEAHHLSEWTPTLFAAQVGDIGIFKALVENGGDPDLTLMQSSSLERFDALWVAVGHGRHDIVSFLTGKLRQRQFT